MGARSGDDSGRQKCERIGGRKGEIVSHVHRGSTLNDNRCRTTDLCRSSDIEGTKGRVHLGSLLC